jgi:hypothetical protein
VNGEREGPPEVGPRPGRHPRAEDADTTRTLNPTSTNHTGQPGQLAFDALVSRSCPTKSRPHGAPTRRHAYAWREGFGYGFRDALRLASRHIDDPHVLAILAELAEYYDLAGGGL